jgi:hypothetical protein
MLQTKKFQIALLLFSLPLLIILLLTNPILTPFLIGGVITQGILGGFSGKVGPVVGGKWKAIDYMRSYVIPANPNTAGQQTVRTKFAKLILLAKKVLPTIIHSYWDPFYSDMSGFNAWVSQNYNTLDGSNDLQYTSKMTNGSLESLPSNSCVYNSGTGVLTCTYGTGKTGNGLDSDSIALVVYDKNLEVFFITDSGTTRNFGSITVNCGIGKTPTNLIGFVFAYRGTGASFIVSDSLGDISA